MAGKNMYDHLGGDCRETLEMLAERVGWDEESILLLAKLARQMPDPEPRASRVAATRELLKKYRLLKAGVDARVTNTAQLLGDMEFERLMEREESVKNQQARAMAMRSAADKVLFCSLENALEQMKIICETDGSPRFRRQYRVLEGRYMHRLPVRAVMELCCIERTEYTRCHQSALETLAFILFGYGPAGELCQETGNTPPEPEQKAPGL